MTIPKILSIVYWKIVAIWLLIVSKKYFVVVDNTLYAINSNITIGDAKAIAYYLIQKAEKREEDLQQDSALLEAKQLLNGKK